MGGVYILKGKIYYVGSTNNIARRINEHKSGATLTTSKMGDFELARWISCEDEKSARNLEKQIKKSGHYERWVK